MTSETFNAADVRVATTYDETGTAVRRRYDKLAGCGAACNWLDSQAQQSIHGQWLTHTGTLSSQDYGYDDAGRLTTVRDTPVGQGCITRRYSYDADSNRRSLAAHQPAAGGGCSTSSPATTTEQSYDAADRLTDPGFEYDPFGRITSVPAGDAGGERLDTTYYVNDRVRSMTQGERSVTLELDALLRPWRRQETNALPEHYYYDDLGDEPRMIERGIDRTVYINGIGGSLDVVAKLTPSAPTIKRLQLSNLHGDIVGEAPLSTAATEPSAIWETDEFGVPREPVRAPKITQVGEPTAAVGDGTSATVTITTPAGTQPGDLLLAGVGALTSGPPITPTGWTPVGDAWSWLDSGESRYKAYWRVAGENEPANHTFTFHGTKKHRVGIVALRNADTSNPIVASGNMNAIGGNATTNPLSLTVDDAAIVTLVGGDRGDADAGGSWAFPSPMTELWDIATGTTANDHNHAAGINVLINGEDLTHPTITISNATGLGNEHWGAITLAIAPRHPTRQYRYRYLGTHQRAIELPAGAIGMGARVYMPQLGRFLQVDPVVGGSCNPYDYACQDPLNTFDLDGEWCVPCIGVAVRVAAKYGPKAVRSLRGAGSSRAAAAAARADAAVHIHRAITSAAALLRGLKPSVNVGWRYKSGGRLVGQVKWGGASGRRRNFIRLDWGGAKPGLHLDIRIGGFRKQHWQPWK